MAEEVKGLSEIERLTLVGRARQKISDLCSGKAQWVLRIPASRDDPDLLLGDALRAQEDTIRALQADKAKLREERDEALGKLQDVRIALQNHLSGSALRDVQEYLKKHNLPFRRPAMNDHTTRELLRDVQAVLETLPSMVLSTTRGRLNTGKMAAHLASLDAEQPTTEECVMGTFADPLGPLSQPAPAEGLPPELPGEMQAALDALWPLLESHNVDPDAQDAVKVLRKGVPRILAALVAERERAEKAEIQAKVWEGSCRDKNAQLARECSQTYALRAERDEAVGLLRNLSYDAEPGNEATPEALEESLAAAHAFLARQPAQEQSQ